MGTAKQSKEIMYGCVLFDDPHQHASGYASINGKTAQRIRGTQDLDTDIIWVTNLCYDIMAISGFKSHTRLKQNDFLRRPIESIAQSLNLTHNPVKTAEVISSLTNRVVRITNDFLEFDFIPRASLKQSIRESIGSTDIKLPDFAVHALQEATESWTQCEKNGNVKGLERVHFQVHPFTIAKEVFNIETPCGDLWKTANQVPTGFQSFEELRQEVGGPFVAKVKISEIDPDFNPLLNFGGSPTFRGSRRQWISSAEMAAIYDFADIQIKELVVMADFNSRNARILNKFKNIPQACLFSLSYQLFFENLWCAAGTTLPPSGFQNLNGNFINPAIPFIRAIDRDICMHAAAQIAYSGLKVHGYGNGIISVDLVGDETPEQILNAAVNSHTIPPMLKPNNDLVFKVVDTPLTVLQSHYINGRLDALLEIDRQVTEATIFHE
jgi:hypothetical protein